MRSYLILCCLVLALPAFGSPILDIGPTPVPVLSGHQEANPVPSPASVPRGNDEGAPVSPWYVGTGLGLSVPISRWDPNFLLGGTGDLLVGRRLFTDWALQFRAEQCYFSGGGFLINNPRFLVEIKWAPGQAACQPYLLGGLGLDAQFASPAGDSTLNLDAVAGLGLQFKVSPWNFIFIESRYNLILTESDTLQDVPVEVGLLVGL